MNSKDWIPFALRLPERGQIVLLIDGDSYPQRAVWRDGWSGWSHWMPFTPPEPPDPFEEWWSRNCETGNMMDSTRAIAKSAWTAALASIKPSPQAFFKWWNGETGISLQEAFEAGQKSLLLKP